MTNMVDNTFTYNHLMLTTKGPIVRIGPNEVHIRDSEYFDVLHSKIARLDKDPWFRFIHKSSKLAQYIPNWLVSILSKDTGEAIGVVKVIKYFASLSCVRLRLF